MKLLKLLGSHIDKIVALGGFASIYAFLGFIVERSYEDALGFKFQIDDNLRMAGFRDFLGQSGAILVRPFAILAIAGVIASIAVPQRWLKWLTSHIKRGSVMWVAPPALLCVGSILAFYPATVIHDLLNDARGIPPFYLSSADPLSARLRDAVICAQVPISVRPVVVGIKKNCEAIGFKDSLDARSFLDNIFRILWGVCAVAFGLFVFASWCAEPPGAGESNLQQIDRTDRIRLQMLTSCAAIGLLLDVLGLCSFYGRVLPAAEIPDATLTFKDASNVPCGSGSKIRTGLILAENKDDYAFYCSADLRFHAVSKTQLAGPIDSSSSPAIAPLTYAMDVLEETGK